MAIRVYSIARVALVFPTVCRRTRPLRGVRAHVEPERNTLGRKTKTTSGHSRSRVIGKHHDDTPKGCTPVKVI